MCSDYASCQQCTPVLRLKQPRPRGQASGFLGWKFSAAGTERSSRGSICVLETSDACARLVIRRPQLQGRAAFLAENSLRRAQSGPAAPAALAMTPHAGTPRAWIQNRSHGGTPPCGHHTGPASRVSQRAASPRTAQSSARPSCSPRSCPLPASRALPQRPPAAVNLLSADPHSLSTSEHELASCHCHTLL